MLTLPRAIGIAVTLTARMMEYAVKVDIAGSIRRRRPMVGDIDLVILPKPGGADAIKARLASSWSTVMDGPQNSIFRIELADRTPLQLDIFWAHPATGDFFTRTPTNFGSLLLCRTGSREHNIYLVEHAKRLGLKWNPYHGVYDGETLIASETEQDIFQALQLDFIPPENRER